ncbi:MAG: histidinol dehydrogenase [Bacteroidetes bacterium]|nr:histidinol dehydrogenase [Bacteroidota bacterium]
MKENIDPFADLPQPQVCPPSGEWGPLLARPGGKREDLDLEVRAVFSALEARGQEALLEYCRAWDGCDATPLQVPQQRLEGAGANVPEALRQAIDLAADQITRYHQAQQTEPKPLETRPGVRCWREARAIERVGLYAPGGQVPLISSVLMTGIPARLAGCAEVLLCTPPASDGWPVPAMLYAARCAGISRVYRVGGAQAIAAMTLGVGMPSVYKLFGPGSARVDKAKALASAYGVALDLPAGPSELALISDGSMPPAWAAADLLAQAEHGVDSQVIALSWSGEWLAEVATALARQIETLPRKDIARVSLRAARLLQTSDEAEAFAFVNAYAPEHLLLGMEDARSKLPLVHNAGVVFLGAWSPESAGDYATGSNHCLPTGGAARAWSGLSLADFQRQMSVQELNSTGLAGLQSTIAALARAEGLEAHARAVELRFEEAVLPGQTGSVSASMPISEQMFNSGKP